MKHVEKDEYLERLWRIKEEEKDSMDALKRAVGENFDVAVIDELLSEDLVKLGESNSKITLTEKGEDYARRIIRAHRIAERLIYDVLGGEFESGACEFEHTVATELVDSICTLLGHPRECPHGMPIPEGECCRGAARTAETSVMPLTQLEVGQCSRVAYVNSNNNDQLLHKIDLLQIRPGAAIRLQQKAPSYVIACEGADIAMDEEVASKIFMWRCPAQFSPPCRKAVGPAGKSSRRGFPFRRKRLGRMTD